MHGKARLLVVEDDADSRELLQIFFQQAGFDVFKAEDVERAIILLDQFHPDALVTDLMMPNLSGIELIEYVRKCPEFRCIPIIVLTASRKEMIDEAYLAGADHVFNKPVNFDKLYQTISKLFEAL